MTIRMNIAVGDAPHKAGPLQRRLLILGSCALTWLAKQLEQFGVSSMPRDLEDFVSFQRNQLANIATSSQPRGKKIPPLVAEFKEVLEMTVPRDDAPPPRVKTPWQIPARAVKPDGIDTLPAGCRVLRTLHLPRGEAG